MNSQEHPLSRFAASPALAVLRTSGGWTQPSLRGGPCLAATGLGHAGFMGCG